MRWTLRLKLALGLAGILTVIMGLSLLLLTLSARNRLEGDFTHFATHLSDVAEAGLENAMVSRDPAEMASIVRSFNRREELTKIVVLNRRGEIKYSGDAADVGRVLSQTDLTCRLCHDRPLTKRPPTIILSSQDGRRILRVARPVLNQPRCQGCHQEQVLGMLITDFSLADMDQQVTATQRELFLWALLTVAIAAGATIGFVYLMVAKPLSHFLRVTQSIGEGDLNQRVALDTGDEIGELSASFDQMVQGMATRTRELEKLNDIAATLITERKRAEQETAIIAEIGRLIGSTLDIDEVYERFATEARKLIPFDRLAVNLHSLHEENVKVAYTSGEEVPGRFKGDLFPLKGSTCEVLTKTRAGLYSHPKDVQGMNHPFSNPHASVKAGMRSLLRVPLISRDEVIGSLHFGLKTADVYTDRDLRLAERIGVQIAGAIVNARLFSDLSKTEKSLRESEEEQRLLIETLPLAVFVETHGKIVYVNPAFLTLFKASSSNEVIGIRLIEFVSPELYDIIEKRRRIMTEEKCVLPPLEQNLRCMDGTFITVVSTPMPFIFQDRPAILTALYDITERKRSEIELGKTYKLLQIHSTEIEDLQAKLKEQAIRDPLTGLFNRRYLEETMERELARASREGIPIGVVMIDIDRFKQINDSHGHKAGDLILHAMGSFLLDMIRTGDIACRYGGEEFLLILPGASRAITAERAEAWRSGFEALRIVYGENVLQATISLGIATYPADGVTADAVIHAADQAMFRAKVLGRNRVVLS